MTPDTTLHYTDDVRDKLAALGLWVLEETRGDYIGSDLSGGDIQDKAEALGLLARVEVKEPCSEEHCSCAGYYDSSEWPIQCLRYAFDRIEVSK